MAQRVPWQTRRQAGWKCPQPGRRRRAAGCPGLPRKRSIFSPALHGQGLAGKAQQASWEMHLFQNKGTEITRQRNVLSAYSTQFARCGIITAGPEGLPAPAAAAGSGQGKRTPRILSHRGGRDFGRRGQADAYVQPVLT